MSALASHPVDTLPIIVNVGNCRFTFAAGTDQASIDKVTAKAKRVSAKDPAVKLAKLYGLREPSKLMLKAMQAGELRRVSPGVDSRPEASSIGVMPDPTDTPDMSDLEAVVAKYRALRDAEAAAREELRGLMRAMIAAGASQSDIARATGWHRQHVNRLLQR